MTLQEIREKRAAKVAEMRALLAKAETEKRSLSAEESGKFDALKAEITALEADEQRAMFMAETERRMQGAPVDRQQVDLESRVSLLEVLQAGMEGRSLTGAALEYSQETERRTGRKASGMFVPLSLLERRVNTTTSATQVVPTDYRADQFIEPFRNKLLARQLGARVLTGLTGNVDIPAYGSGVTSGWVAENGALSTSDMTFAKKSLTPKHVGALSEMSRQLIQQSSPAIEQLLRDDMSAALATALDSAMISGGGTNQPKGILTTTGIQTAAIGSPNWTKLLGMLEKAELSNASPNAWLTHPSVKKTLASILDSAGLPNYLWRDGKVADLPAYATNQVALKTGSPNTGRLILGDFTQIILGVWSELDILVNPYDSTAYARGGVLIRAMATADIVIRHPEAFIVSDDITLA